MRRGWPFWVIFCSLALAACAGNNANERAVPGVCGPDCLDRQRVELQSVLSRFDGTQIERREGGVFITIECDSLFESDGGSMKPATCAEIAKMAEVVKKYPDTNIKVEVHTDCVHSEEKNLALSELQAWTIKKSLVEKGISQSRIKARGWGESKPAASNATEEGRKANRRVTIILAPSQS